MILCLETATPVCSVALVDRERIISVRQGSSPKSHASLLTVFASDVLKEAGIKASELEAVAVSKGPGSYTGLRIGVSAAKGIAYGASLPLIGIETTLPMFYGMKVKASQLFKDTSELLLCPMLDARRMEVYYCIYDINATKKKEIAAEIIGPDSFRDIGANHPILFFGDGAMKCREIITRPDTYFESDFTADASFMQKPAYESFDNNRVEDIAYFEPFYLKDFIATIPVKNRMA